MAVAELFRALGEPTRLEMVERLSDGHSYTISSLSEGLDITRQGARKHLQILVDSKIVALKPHGRDTVVELNKHSIAVCKKFIAALEVQWDKKLQKLRNAIEKK